MLGSTFAVVKLQPPVKNGSWYGRRIKLKAHRP